MTEPLDARGVAIAPGDSARRPPKVRVPGVAKGACAYCYAGAQPRKATACWGCERPLVRVGERNRAYYIEQLERELGIQ